MTTQPTITLYTKPSCVQCDRTKLVLDRHGAEYTTVDMSADAQALEAVKELGHTSAPVVVVREPGATRDVDWSGLRPDKIEKHITAHLIQKEA